MNEKRQSGLTLLEILIALFLLSTVVLANGVLVRALGLLGAAQGSPSRYERPARLRTLAMEFVQAEMEYLRNRSYDELRNAAACLSTVPVPLRPSGGGPGGRVPADGYLPGEPRLPSAFAAADILITDEPIVGAAPDNCRPRRVSVNVYLQPADVTGGVIFLRGETVRAP